MAKLILNNDIDFRYNPFSGLTNDELKNTIVLKEQIKKVLLQLEQDRPIIVELIGKKGRGKTTHLIYLSEHIPNSSLHLLTGSYDKQELLNDNTDAILVDSIHRIKFIDRLKFYKNTKLIVLTSHVSKIWEYKLVGKESLTIKFKGINVETLEKIIKNRIINASNGTKEEDIELNKKEVIKLIHKFGDDYRSIINYLYDNFRIQ